MVDGLQMTLSPVDGDADVDRFTVPVKPFVGETVAVKEPDDPDAKLTLDGLALRPKSGDDDTGLKNSVIAFALASFEVRVGRLQLVSIVFVSE